MTTLAQLLGLRKTGDKVVERKVTTIYHDFQRPGLFEGVEGHYTPFADDATEADRLPPRRELIQRDAEQLMRDTAETTTLSWDRTASIEFTNANATTTLVLPNGTEVENMTPTMLLWLEQQLSYMLTELKAIPTLDHTVNWSSDRDTGHDAFVTDPVTTYRQMKVRKSHVLWEPPDASYKQPAQVEAYTVDEAIGSWSTIRLSRALPPRRKQELLDRLQKVHDAVKSARLKANETEVVNVKVGTAVWDYVLGD